MCFTIQLVRYYSFVLLGNESLGSQEVVRSGTALLAQPRGCALISTVQALTIPKELLLQIYTFSTLALQYRTSQSHGKQSHFRSAQHNRASHARPLTPRPTLPPPQRTPRISRLAPHNLQHTPPPRSPFLPPIAISTSHLKSPARRRVPAVFLGLYRVPSRSME